MPALDELTALFGWNNGVANMADSGSAPSRAISAAILETLGVTTEVQHVGQTAGLLLEETVANVLGMAMPELMAPRFLRVERGRRISDFTQYSHLATLNEVVRRHPDPVIRVAFGGDYLIKPDIVVAQVTPSGREPFILHAAIPCKWTLRSDRAQNVRHEAVTMIRNRRGRLPHITPVTAEPLPTRLASLARGTGEVDMVYHVALDELSEACARTGASRQVEALQELVEADRLRDLSRLAADLAV